MLPDYSSIPVELLAMLASLVSHGLDCYVAITAVIPVLAALLVSLLCAALFVLMLALGFVLTERWVYSLAVFGCTGLVLAGGEALMTWVGRRRKPGLIVSLRDVLRHQVAARDVGHKARNLALLSSTSVRVPLGWVLTANAFEAFLDANALDPQADSSIAFADAVRSKRIPKRTLRRVVRTLEAAAAPSFLLRSSFFDEDTPGRAFPGLYESVRWDRAAGLEALERAILEVWASYWTARAIDYRREAQVPAAGARRLAVLINVTVPHDHLGFASSAEVNTGFRERHIVEVSTPDREWTCCHSLLPNTLEPAAGSLPEHALPDPIVRRISRLAGEAEVLLDCPVEIEWGLVDGELWAYQARPLTAMTYTDTFTNSYVTDLPRYPLTPLARSFLFGDEPPARMLGAGLRAFGLGGLEDEDVRVFAGGLFLRWTQFKPFFFGSGLRGMTAGGALRFVGTVAVTVLRRGRSRADAPNPSDPPDPSLDLSALLARLSAIRDKQVMTLTLRQNRVLQVAATVDALLRQLDPHGRSPVPRVRSPLAELSRALRDAGSNERERLAALLRSAWYLADREAEISAPRVIDDPERHLGLVAMQVDDPAQHESKSGRRRRNWLVRLRDRLLDEREYFNVAINAANYEARLVAEAVSKHLGAEIEGWKPDDVFYLTLPELKRHAAGEIHLSAVLHAIGLRRWSHQTFLALTPIAVLHVDDRGSWIPEHHVSFDPNVLTTGIPLGGGSAEGKVRVVRTDERIQPDAVVGAIVVLPDPSAIWTSLAAAAAGVVFARGGPLSHLAIWCRERGIPTVVAARRIAELVRTGDRIHIDGNTGQVRRG